VDYWGHTAVQGRPGIVYGLTRQDAYDTEMRREEQTPCVVVMCIQYVLRATCYVWRAMCVLSLICVVMCAVCGVVCGLHTYEPNFIPLQY
jgi:hypothetical protein